MSEKQSKIKKFFHSAFQVVWTPIAIPIFLFTQYIMMLEKNKADKINKEIDDKYKLSVAKKVIEKLMEDKTLGQNWKIHSISYDDFNYNFENDYFYFMRDQNFPYSVVYSLTDKISNEKRLFEKCTKNELHDNVVVLNEISLDTKEYVPEDLESYW